MKSGETRFIVKKLDTKKPYNSVGFRLSNGKTTIKKSTDAEDTKDKVLVQDGVFLIPLQQTDTQALEGNVTLEAQINYENHSVRKSDDNFMFVGSTLGTDFVQGSEPAQDDGIEVVMTAIEEGVAVIVNPEASQELIDAVTDLFQDTKDIAQSVRDDADNGEFDGFSPQVTVKTETPSTYILHIKDADHEFDTPNLQGQGGEGSIEVGDGLKRVGNVLSVDLDDNSILEFDNHKLSADTSGLANALTVSIDSSTYVMSIDLWHNNTRLGGGTVDLPLESVVVSGSYDAQTKEVVLTLQSGSTVRFSVADLVSGLQAEITPQNKLDATLIQTNEYNNFVTLDEKQIWTDKQDKLTAGTNITIDANNVISASGGGSYTFTNGLAESSGTVGIDLKSGTELQITSGELDIDLSSYATTTSVSGKQDKTTISTDTTSTTVSLTLADNHEYRYTQDLTSLTLTMPSGDFITSIVFASGSTPTSMTYDSSIKWSGDDVTNGQFVPSADKDYDICLYYNGLNVNGIVRGV